MLKLVLETEHLRWWVLELFLPVLLCASSIQLKLVERFCESESLMPSWRSSSRWFECWTEVRWFAKRSISWASSKRAGWPVGFGAIRIVSEPTSSIRSFNTEVTTEPRKRGGCSAWLAEASYADETFVR